MFHLYYYRLPELQTMRSVSGDYSLPAAVHHRYDFVLRLPTRLFSATRRTKQCLRASPAVKFLSPSGPSATATKSPWVQTVVPVEPCAVSSACSMPTGKDKFQHFVIPISITVSGRLSSRFSAFFKSVGKCAPPAPHHLENNPSPSKQKTLATGPSPEINESSVCLMEFTREKGCSRHPFSSELSDPLCGNDRPPGYISVVPEPQDPEEDQRMPGGDAVTAELRHGVSLDQNPAVRTDVCDATPGNRVIEQKQEKVFTNENIDDRTTCPAEETRLDLEVAPNSTLTLASPSVYNLGPTQVSRQPVIERNFLHFYETLKPYIIRGELPLCPVQRTPPPIDDGPLPESDGFRVLEGPFTTPAGGTSASEAQGPQCEPPPLPTNSEAAHEREPGVKHPEPCLAPAITALTYPTGHRLVSQPVAPARLSDEILGKTMTWDIDILHKRTGLSQTLNSTLRSMQNRWRILEFDLAFETSDASLFRNNYSFAFKPLALQLPCSSPRITELDDENEPVLREATGEIQSYNGGAGGSGTTQVQQGSGSRSHVQQSGSTQLPRGKKRANEDDGDDRKGKKKERREEPPVGDDPPPCGSEDEGVFCPFWVIDPQNCKKKSCSSPKKNLSKLKEHLRRAHFLHLSCPFENCVFDAGDKFQITRHQKTSHGGEIREPIPRTTDSKLLRKNEALGTRNLTWDEICDICFREEPEEPIMSLDGAGDFESEDEEEGDEGLYAEEDDEDPEGQEDHDDREARQDNMGYQGEYASNRGAMATVEENHKNPIPPSTLEVSLSTHSDAASTTIDTPGDFLLNDDLPDFPDWFDGMLGGLNQGEGHLPSPTPDHNSFPNSGQPPLPIPADVVAWERHIARKFEILRGACFEGLENRRKTSPGDALVDADRFFREMMRSARVALDLPNGGSGPVAYYSKDSFTYPMPPASQSSIPFNFPLSQMFPNFPTGGDSSTMPSLTHDSRSSYSSIPYGIPQDLYSYDIPAAAPAPQPTGPGMAEPQAEDGAIRIPNGHVLAHINPKGRWSVGGDPRAIQPRFDQTPD